MRGATGCERFLFSCLSQVNELHKSLRGITDGLIFTTNSSKLPIHFFFKRMNFIRVYQAGAIKKHNPLIHWYTLPAVQYLPCRCFIKFDRIINLRRIYGEFFECLCFHMNHS
jgi:hypothetical protein